jgi:hypothetical protein
VQVDLLLCDHAEAVNGKLYINGGGWSILYAANRPATLFLAVVITVDWGETNRQHALTAELVTIDGEPVMAIAPPGELTGPIKAVGNLEVGRPPGVKPGTPLPAPMALGFANLVLEPGHYLWRVTVDEKRAEKTFQVVDPPQLPGFPPRPR